jgi:hypothetical protein
MGRSSRQRGFAALCALAAAALAGCGGGGADEPRVERAARLGVVVTGTELPPSLRIVAAAPRKAPYRGVARVSSTYAIGPSGRLPAPVTIRIPLQRRLPAGSAVVVGVSETPRGPLRIVEARLNPGGRSVRVRVSHLSFFTTLWVNVKTTFRTLKETVLDGLTSDVLAEARPPTCGDEAGARDGYTITSDSKNTVYWCFGLEDGKRVLRVVNNRRYPLLVSHPGLTVVDAGRLKLELARLSRALSGKRTIIFPREEAVFAVELSGGRRGGVRTELDGLGQSLYQLEVGISAAVTALARLGVKAKGAELMRKALDSEKCASALGETGGDALAKCLPPLLKQNYGAQGAIAAAAIEVGSLASFFRSQANALFDQLNGRDSYRVWVVRQATTPAPAPGTTTDQAPAAQAPPATTPAAPSTSTFEIGAPFEDDCVVAWPTAPVRTSSTIQLTMSCAHVPSSEFLLTHVIYGDPDLPITPSTGQVHVVGRVVDVAQSEYGFRQLVVEASEVRLP